MNVENNMVIGLPYPAVWDRPEPTHEEVLDDFREWYEGAEPDHYYFELFLEHWSPLELHTFMEMGVMQAEFKKYQAEQVKSEFEEETGHTISIDDVIKEL